MLQSLLDWLTVASKPETAAPPGAELERARKEAREAQEELKAFTHAVTHDLRAPLQTLDAFCALLEKELSSETKAETREYMARIRSGAARMDAILLGLTQLSRVMTRPLSVEETDLTAAARETASALARAAPDRAVAFSAEPGLRAAVDAGLARVVLGNLLDNAWKFTARNASAAVAFGLLRLPGEDAFFVRDDGAGFDMANAQGLFTPFHRLHSASEFPGAGVGLAAVRRVAERHGGRVWAESAPGRGTAVYFTLAPKAGAADHRGAGGNSPAPQRAPAAG